MAIDTLPCDLCGRDIARQSHAPDCTIEKRIFHATMTADEIERRTRPARMSDTARASARQHPYFVDLYTGWDDHDPLTVGFQTEDEARAFAASRPEPIIDLVKRHDGIVGARRMIAYPGQSPAWPVGQMSEV